jgi:hypothetical protein
MGGRVSTGLILKSRLDELEQTIERGLTHFVEVGNALLNVRDEKLYKHVLGYKTFEAYCQARWNLTRPRAYQMIEAAEVTNVLSKNLDKNDLSPNEHQARELGQLKRLAEDEQEIVEAWREAKQAAELEGTNLTASVVRNAVKKRVDRIKRENAAAEIREKPIQRETESDNVRLIHGDFREVFTDADLNEGIIISDPPYPREYLPLYSDLASLGMDWNCRRMILMVGQSILADVMQRILTTSKAPLDGGYEVEQWEYHWCGCYLTVGPSTRVWDRKVSTSWKPILSFGYNEDDWPNLTTDLFKSTGDDKQHHHWGQNEAGMAEIVEAFTEPGDLVIDPFLGGGTTAVVCKKLGRQFVGCDTDPVAIQESRERVNAC